MKVALIDSCGVWPGAVASARFVSVADDAGPRVLQAPPTADPTGHGTQIARILTEGPRAGASIDLLLAQVFSARAPATPAAVAAAIDWSVAAGAGQIHLSLGLTSDRAVLRGAVARALAANVLLVAATPARGGAVYPAAYEGVLQGTGDARCGPADISVLGERRFGGCPRFPGRDAPDSDRVPLPRGGASAGAAWVSRAALDLLLEDAPSPVAARLARIARYRGLERRGAAS